MRRANVRFHLSGSLVLEIEAAPSGVIRAVNVTRTSHSKDLDNSAVAWGEGHVEISPGLRRFDSYPIIFEINGGTLIVR